jgi:hypothetical protein
VTVLRIRGVALPGGDPVDLFADVDRWTDDPVPGAELAAEGCLVPGLVDLALLDAPRAVILRGRLVHHRAAG